MPPTPPRYWDVDMPSIDERKKMGLYVVTSSPVQKKFDSTAIKPKKEINGATRKLF